MSSRSVAEIAENFGEYLRQVTDHGETITVTSGGVPVAELRPVAKARTVGEFLHMIQSLPPLDPDEREAFARDLEAAHAELNARPLPPDPWES